jgi:hypothetical protein
MTKPQGTALAHHCRLATETLHPRFRARRLDGYGVVLTVNSGYE